MQQKQETTNLPYFWNRKLRSQKHVRRCCEPRSRLAMCDLWASGVLQFLILVLRSFTQRLPVSHSSCGANLWLILIQCDWKDQSPHENFRFYLYFLKRYKSNLWLNQQLYHIAQHFPHIMSYIYGTTVLQAHKTSHMCNFVYTKGYICIFISVCTKQICNHSPKIHPFIYSLIHSFIYKAKFWHSWWQWTCTQKHTTDMAV